MIDDIFFYVVYSVVIISSIVGIWTFLKISSLKINWKLLLLILTLFLVAILTGIKPFLEFGISIIEIILFIVLLRKQDRLYTWIGTAIFVVDLLLIEALILVIVNDLILSIFVSIIWLLVSIILIRNFHIFIFKQLTGKNRLIFFGLEIYLYFTVSSLYSLYKAHTGVMGIRTVFSIFLVVQLFTMIAGYIEMIRIQKNLLEKRSREG